MIQNSCDATNSKVFVHQNHLGLIHCYIGEQDGLVKPKDYQGEHIVGAGEPTHMISKNLLAG